MGGTTFILSDGSLLEVPCMDVKVDGLRLEGIGVTPTVYVDAALEYSHGRDPQLEAAINMAEEIVEVGGE